MKPAPAPLFNYRKRQRQAIVSDPQQLPSNATNSLSLNMSIPDSDQSCTTKLCETQKGEASSLKQVSCSYNNQSNRQSINASKSSHNTVRDTSTFNGVNAIKHVTKPGMMNILGRFDAGHISVTSFSNINTNKETKRLNNVRGSAPLANPSKSGTSRGIGNREAAYGSQTRTATASSSLLSSSLPFTCPSVADTFKNKSYGGTSTTTRKTPDCFVKNAQDTSFTTCSTSHNVTGRGRSLVTQRGKGSAWAAKSEMTSRNQFADIHGPQSQRGQNVMATIGRDNKFLSHERLGNSLGRNGEAQEVSGHCESKKVTGNSTTSDKSMRLFTCSIADLKSWPANVASCGVVMFEVYGAVDSATLRDKSGTGKEFVLRDDASSIKCIFYEIDRDLPRLIRGQVYRVIGLVNSQRDLLKVVSVRLAEKEERDICHLATQLSRREMETITRLHHEP